MRALALAMVVTLCGGCGLVEYKPPSPTVLRLSPAPADGGHGDKPIDLGFEDVGWDTLQSGYGAAAQSYHPRDHEGYLYFGYDRWQSSQPGRSLLITPLRPAGAATCLYRFQLIVPEELLAPDAKGAGRRVMLEGTLTSPPVKAGDRRLRFDVQNVPLTLSPPGAGRYTLSGRIVATPQDPRDFEELLRQFNSDGFFVEAQR
ncbi:MAG: hypothetical protein NTV86_08890 [Planctomycetota bacterium]|nr:hypothetical protein [Planctomycetota bacterium]